MRKKKVIQGVSDSGINLKKRREEIKRTTVSHTTTSLSSHRSLNRGHSHTPSPYQAWLDPNLNQVWYTPTYLPIPLLAAERLFPPLHAYPRAALNDTAHPFRKETGR